MSRAAAVKLEPVKVAKVIHIEKGKIFLSLRASGSRKILADKMERWRCTIKKCKCYIKYNEVERFSGGM